MDEKELKEFLDRSNQMLQQLQERREAARVQQLKQRWEARFKKSPNFSVVNKFALTDGATGFIVRADNPAAGTPLSAEAQRLLGPIHPFTYNGYVRFPKRPTKEKSYNGILRYVPCPGGLTYAEEWKDGMVYGWDTSHYGDSKKEHLRDLVWLENAVRLTGASIFLAATQYEDRFLAAETEQAKAAVIDEYHEVLRLSGLGDFSLRENIGALIAMMSGRL